MLALRLPPEIEKRLDALAEKTGRTKSYYAREAILRHLEDIEDAYTAVDRLKKPGKRRTLHRPPIKNTVKKGIKQKPRLFVRA
jgi:RHH-type rel operon transcriptional repressor/antitoxin RelB